MVLHSPAMMRRTRPRAALAGPPGLRRAGSRTTAGLLTRRGWVVLVVALGLVLGAAYLAGTLTTSGAVYVPTDTVVVHQGETLWSIATQRTAPGQDVRQTVAVITSLNQLEGVSLVAGDQLWVPPLP